MQHRCWPVLGGDAGRHRPGAGLADHPLRPPRDRRRERRRAVRRDRDRRDPHAAGDDDDRRGEGGGAGHRPAGRGDHRPLRRDDRRRRCSSCTASCATRMPAKPVAATPEPAWPGLSDIRDADPPTFGAGDDVPWWDPRTDAAVAPETDAVIDRRRERSQGQPGAGPPDPTRRRAGPLLRRPGRPGHRGALRRRRRHPRRRWCSSTTRRPTCTSGTAATSTSHPTSSNRCPRRPAPTERRFVHESHRQVITTPSSPSSCSR